MIIKVLFEVIESMVKILLAPLPSIPQLPPEIDTVMNTVIGYLRNSVAFINAIFPLTLAVKLATFALLIKNFKRIYNGVMFIIRKIPFLGIK